MAIRDDYENYRGTNASSAAFIKAGRWQVKFRVTGPEKRQDEVEAAMDALLAGMRFAKGNPAQDPLPISLSACANDDQGQTDARLLPDAGRVGLLEQALVLTFDGAGVLGVDQEGKRETLPSRVPQTLCMSRLAVNGTQLPLLRAADGAARSIDGRTRLLDV